jgi:hypothetical protein
MRGWLTVDWLTILSTLVGGAIALLGSVLAHTLRSRDERRRKTSADRQQSYVDYLIAHDKAHARIRQLADPGDVVRDLAVQARRAFGEAGVYEARERLLLAASPPVVAPAELALRRLADLRDKVRDGAQLYTVLYHEAYHPYAESLWALRRVIRADLGARALSTNDLDRESWDDRATCDFCQHQAAAGLPTSAPAASIQLTG